MEFPEIGGQPAVSQISGIFYIGRTGVWVSKDEGETWTPGPGTSPEIRSLTTHPADGLKAYAGTGDGKVHRTGDGGTTWETALLQATQCIKSLAVNPIKNPGDEHHQIWAIGGQCFNPTADSTIYVSLNGGASFTPKKIFNAAPLEVSRIAVDGNGIVYAAGNGGVWVSADNGENFDKKYYGMVFRLVINPVNGRIHVDGYHGSDNGNTWTADRLPGLLGISPSTNPMPCSPPRARVSGGAWTGDSPGVRSITVSMKCWSPR